MDKKLLLYLITGIIFTFLAGTLLHFAYEWSGTNFWVGLFAPVSESIWEHMKLLFFPMLIYSMVSCILFRRVQGSPLWESSLEQVLFRYSFILIPVSWAPTACFWTLFFFSAA